MLGTGAKTSEAVDNASGVVGEIPERGFWVLGTTGGTSETVACVLDAPSETSDVVGWMTSPVIWVVGAMGGISEMDGCVAEISETISWIVEVISENLLTADWEVSTVNETSDSEAEAVVEFVGETSVIADLVADVIGEILVMFGWLPRFVETVEKIK